VNDLTDATGLQRTIIQERKLQMVEDGHLQIERDEWKH
jgi:hypothetical protein